MTTFPENYDSDLEIPRVDQDVSEISGDVINSLRDALFTIQKVIGLNAQGNRATFNDRMNVSIDVNGYIKRDALERVGLISLPVINRHVGANAAVQESKLDLDYGTKFLKNLVDSMRTDFTGVSAGVSSTTAALNLHILGLGNFHDGYHIKINVGPQVGIAGMEATTVGDALNEFGTRLLSGNEFVTPHIDLNYPSDVKHRAAEISVDASDFITIDRASSNVQEAFDSLDEQSGALGIAHVDGFHSNGILKEVNSDTYYNSGRKLLGPSVMTYTGGTSIVQIADVTSFATLDIKTGDILVVPTNLGDSGQYQIRAVGPLVDGDTLGALPVLDVDQLVLFHTFSETKVVDDNVMANIYKPAAASSEFSPLACSVRNNETIVDTISVMSPDAARVVSVGFNGAILNADGYELGIRVGFGNQSYRELIIPGLNLERLNTNQAAPVSAESVAERINAFVSDPDLGHNFPITAFRVGNELAISHNLVGPDYTIEISDGYTGTYALGLDAYGADVVGEEILGNTNSIYSVNGVALNTVRTVFSGYASITEDTDTFSLYDSDDVMIDPLEYGIGAGSVIHITGHPTGDTNGSYTLFTANTTSVSLFNPEEIDAPDNPTRFNVTFLDTHVRLSSLESTETEMGLVQVFIDATGQTHLHQRLMYGTNLGSAFEITNITNTFPIGDIIILVGLDSDFVEFNIIDGSMSGKTVRIHENFEGSFKLYHSNGLDFITANIIPGNMPGGLETLTVNEPVPYDQALLLCTCHFNGTMSITNLIDERLFGTLGSEQVRDDFIEIFSQKPIADLHSNGVIKGFDVLDVLMIDSITEMQAIPLRGGIAYVNGVRLAVETQKVIIHSFDEEGSLISADRIIGINDFGSIQVFSDELGEILTDGYSSSSTFGKILPLYRVTITNGGIRDIVDIRRFINNIDEKLDIVVDETNNIVGNFKSLEGALLYAEKYPGNERLTIKIVGTVNPLNPLTIPNGVSIIGEAPYGSDSKNQIVNAYNHNSDFITLLGNNRLENIGVVSETPGLQGSLVAVSGGNVNIEKCSLRYSGTISSNAGDIGVSVNASHDVRIVNNKINNVFTGISSELGCSDLAILDNKIDGVSGVGLPCGIKIGTTTRESTNIEISNNKINIDATADTDLRAIYVDVGETIDKMRITGNTISGALNGLSENNLSNGIRIISNSATGNKITDLVVLDNHIENVKLHDSSVYAMYIEDVGRAIVSRNTIINTGVFDTNYTDIGYIWIDDSVDSIEIDNNVLSDGGALRGIYIKSTSTLVSILNNTLKNIGETSANYIYGLAHRASVSGNKLIGPGNYGIWWKGSNSKISDNHLASDGTDYAFKTGILAQASYIDVENNTVIDMTDNESVGIANANSANEGLKIIGNRITGDTMARLIGLSGNYHVVSGNKLRNDTVSSSTTYFIQLAVNSDSVSILGNTFEGVNASGAIATSFIYSSGKVTKASIMNNIMLDSVSTSMLTSGPIMLASTDVEDCVIMGNRFPDDSLYSTESVIGRVEASTSFAIFNNNLFGVNKGMLDTRGVHACEAVTAYDSDAASFGIYPHWVFNDGGSYWEVNSYPSSDVRYLYFPISGLPNGSVLKSVEVQLKNSSQTGDTFDIRIYKRSNKTIVALDLVVTAVSDIKSVQSASGVIGNTTNAALVDEVNSGGISEIINYNESNYYVQISHSKNTPINPTDIRIYGMTITYRY